MSVPLAIATGRLQLRWLEAGDAAFILRLVNDPDWLRFIGDKSVASLGDARRYIETGPAAMYRSHGFGLNRVALAADDRAIGICGILRRETLAEADLGFALLPEYRGQGYALEAAGAVLEYARTALGIGRLAAIVDPDNVGSIRLLKKLGFRRAGEYCADRSPRALELYNVDLDAPRDSGPLESQDIVDVIEA